MPPAASGPPRDSLAADTVNVLKSPSCRIILGSYEDRVVQIVDVINLHVCALAPALTYLPHAIAHHATADEDVELNRGRAPQYVLGDEDFIAANCCYPRGAAGLRTGPVDHRFTGRQIKMAPVRCGRHYHSQAVDALSGICGSGVNQGYLKKGQYKENQEEYGCLTLQSYTPKCLVGNAEGKR